MATSPSTTQNPLSLRLYKVLAANFDDEATKEALDTLAELYAPVPTAAATTKSYGTELKREQDEDQEDADHENDDDRPKTLNGVQTAGDPRPVTEPVPGEIAANARKNLRRDVESKLAESSRRFLTAFAEVDKVCCIHGFACMLGRLYVSQQLDTLQEHIGVMRLRCDEAQTQLHETNDACRSLLDRAGSLREQRKVDTPLGVYLSLILYYAGRMSLPDIA